MFQLSKERVMFLRFRWVPSAFKCWQYTVQEERRGWCLQWGYWRLYVFTDWQPRK